MDSAKRDKERGKKSRVNKGEETDIERKKERQEEKSRRRGHIHNFHEYGAESFDWRNDRK